MNPSIAPERFYDRDPRNPANAGEPTERYYIDDYPFIPACGTSAGYNQLTEDTANKHLDLLDRWYDTEAEWMAALRTLADAARMPVGGGVHSVDVDRESKRCIRTVTINPKESE